MHSQIGCTCEVFFLDFHRLAIDRNCFVTNCSSWLDSYIGKSNNLWGLLRLVFGKKHPNLGAVVSCFWLLVFHIHKKVNLQIPSLSTSSFWFSSRWCSHCPSSWLPSWKKGAKWWDFLPLKIFLKYSDKANFSQIA